MKHIIKLVSVIILFTSCEKGGTYYCRTYHTIGSTTYYHDDAVKKWFVSYKDMQNYSDKHKRYCEKR